jgi:hypothetical protein
MEEERTKKGQTQTKLDAILEKQAGPKEFTREGALDVIAQFVACDDQVWRIRMQQCRDADAGFKQALAVAEKPMFRNCLIAMRPRTNRRDLPSTHDIGVYIHNEFCHLVE